MLHVRRFTANDEAAWQSYVNQHAAARPFHLSGWMKALPQVFSVKALPLIADDGGQICGLTNAYISHGFLFPTEIMTLPGGILADDVRCASALVEALKRHGEKLKAGRLTIRGSLSAVVANPSHVLTKVHSQVDLRAGTQVIWNGFTSNHRRKIRKSEKNDFRIDLSNQIPNSFYPLYQDNQHRLGTPVISGQHFDAINQHLRDSVRFVGLYKETKLVAGALLIAMPSQWESIYVAARRDILSNYAMYGLYWGMIESSAQGGAKLLDLGSSIEESGNHKFKRQWSSEDVIVPYSILELTAAKKSTKAGASNRPTDTQKDSNLLSELWKRLPLSLANRLGPVLRHSRPFG